jgi:hypothetical protein
MEIIALYCDNQIENLVTFNEQSARFLNVKLGVVYSQRCALKGSVHNSDVYQYVHVSTFSLWRYFFSGTEYICVNIFVPLVFTPQCMHCNWHVTEWVMQVRCS